MARTWKCSAHQTVWKSSPWGMSSGNSFIKLPIDCWTLRSTGACSWGGTMTISSSSSSQSSARTTSTSSRRSWNRSPPNTSRSIPMWHATCGCSSRTARANPMGDGSSQSKATSSWFNTYLDNCWLPSFHRLSPSSSNTLATTSTTCSPCPCSSRKYLPSKTQGKEFWRKLKNTPKQSKRISKAKVRTSWVGGK